MAPISFEHIWNSFWNSYPHTLGSVIGGVTVLGVARLIHVERRNRQHACLTCGASLKLERMCYMRESPRIHSEKKGAKLVETYVFTRCGLGHLHIKIDERWMSKAALWWRHRYHPEHFEWNRLIEALFLEAKEPLPKGKHLFHAGQLKEAAQVTPFIVPKLYEHFAGDQKRNRASARLKVLVFGANRSRPFTGNGSKLPH